MATNTRFYRKLAVLAKLETVYGTDPTPTGALNALMISNVTATPLDGEKVSRDVILPFFGDQGFVLAGVSTKLEFEVEIAGAGAAGDIPAYGVLLRACSMTETVVATTSVKYQPVTDQPESVCLYANMDGVNHIMLGARGTFTVDVTNKKIPKFKFTMTGLLGPVADLARPVIDLGKWQSPVVPSKLNTPIFSLHGTTAAVVPAESLALDFGGQVEGRFLIGAESVEITDRKISGTAVLEARSLATKDWFDIAKNNVKGPLHVQHGTVAGNIVEFEAPKVQIGSPTQGNSQGVLTYSLPLTLTPDVADDELVITVR